jgi:hypothetical protein
MQAPYISCSRIKSPEHLGDLEITAGHLIHSNIKRHEPIFIRKVLQDPPSSLHEHSPDYAYFFTNSTLRLFAFPSGVELSEMGLASP